CVECNPELLPRSTDFGWCKVHGVHDCSLEHPAVAQILTAPRISPADLRRAERALKFTERPENNRKCKLHERRIQFVSQEAVEKAGIDVEPVWTGAVVETVMGNGEITYDQTRSARLSARVPGTVFKVCKQVGDPVERGEALALADAAEVGKAKSELFQALLQVRLWSDTVQRLEDAHRQGAIPERSYREQTNSLNEARVRLVAAREAMTNLGLPVSIEEFQNVPAEKLPDRLRFLGLPESITGSLDPHKTTGNLLALSAPFDGIVTSCHVVGGEVVDSSKLLFLVVDTRQMWLFLDLGFGDVNSFDHA